MTAIKKQIKEQQIDQIFLFSSIYVRCVYLLIVMLFPDLSVPVTAKGESAATLTTREGRFQAKIRFRRNWNVISKVNTIFTAFDRITCVKGESKNTKKNCYISELFKLTAPLTISRCSSLLPSSFLHFCSTPCPSLLKYDQHFTAHFGIIFLTVWVD